MKTRLNTRQIQVLAVAPTEFLRPAERESTRERDALRRTAWGVQATSQRTSERDRKHRMSARRGEAGTRRITRSSPPALAPRLPTTCFVGRLASSVQKHLRCGVDRFRKLRVRRHLLFDLIDQAIETRIVDQ